MLRFARDTIMRSLRSVGIQIRPRSPRERELDIVEASANDRLIMASVRPFTMTSAERLWALINAAAYVSANAVRGDFCECGVWRGGSSMAAALKLKELGDHRRLWLYDTFSGMTPPETVDRTTSNGTPAAQLLGDAGVKAVASLDEVKANIRTTSYPRELVRYVEGPVETTLRVPENVPDRIALLRLDTDWYASTRIELEILYERLSPGGVLIVDDYGHWDGARRAVDEFFATRTPRILLNRIDYTGRIGVKLASG